MADNGTIGHVQTLMCPKPGPVIPPGTPEMRAWDGKTYKSPAQSYIDGFRGGVNPAVADSFHHQQAANLSDALIGEAIGAGIGHLLKLGARLFGAAKGLVKAPPVKPTGPQSSTAGNGGVFIAKTAAKPMSSAEHRAWLEKNGYRNAEDHVKSADGSRPVELTHLREGDEIHMYVRDGGAPGSYATTPGTSPSSLAIDGTGRHVEVFSVKTPFEVIQSTAGEFPTGVYPGVGGPGGGTQYQLPNGWQDFVTKR